MNRGTPAHRQQLQVGVDLLWLVPHDVDGSEDYAPRLVRQLRHSVRRRRITRPRSIWSTLGSALLTLAAACGGGPGAEASAGQATDQPTTTTATTSVPDSVASAHPRQPTRGRAPRAARPDPAQPLSAGDFADPYLLIRRDDPLTPGDGPLSFATNTIDTNVPVGYFEGGSFVFADALPQLPTWSGPGFVWAPSVLRVGDEYRLYYSTWHRASGRQCISVAISDTAEGPYSDTSIEPLICAFDQGGSIDPSPVRDHDRLYLLWKSDGNCCGLPTVIYAQPLDATGTRTIGPPVELVRADQPWEDNLVEAPSMVQRAGTWYLFYSGNEWDSADYAIGWATCGSPTGPCTKPTTGPLMASDASRAGPGGAEAISATTTGIRLVFHAWTPDAVGYENGGQRRLYVQTVSYERLGT